MRVFAVLALFALPAYAAAPLNVSWTNPTTYSDGSALAASAITKTRVEYGANTASGTGCTFGAKLGEVSTTGSATSIATPSQPVGSYAVRAYTTASGAESVASSPACGVVPQAPPNSPAGVTVTVTITVTP
jgi:hypothetical protein